MAESGNEGEVGPAMCCGNRSSTRKIDGLYLFMLCLLGLGFHQTFKQFDFC